MHGGGTRGRQGLFLADKIANVDGHLRFLVWFSFLGCWHGGLVFELMLTFVTLLGSLSGILGSGASEVVVLKDVYNCCSNEIHCLYYLLQPVLIRLYDISEGPMM